MNQTEAKYIKIEVIIQSRRYNNNVALFVVVFSVIAFSSVSKEFTN